MIFCCCFNFCSNIYLDFRPIPSMNSKVQANDNEMEKDNIKDDIFEKDDENVAVKVKFDMSDYEGRIIYARN